jgi:hypothetical protein
MNELKENLSSFNSLRKLENIWAWGNGTMDKLKEVRQWVN